MTTSIDKFFKAAISAAMALALTVVLAGSINYSVAGAQAQSSSAAEDTTQAVTPAGAQRLV